MSPHASCFFNLFRFCRPDECSRLWRVDRPVLRSDRQLPPNALPANHRLPHHPGAPAPGASTVLQRDVWDWGAASLHHAVRFKKTLCLFFFFYPFSPPVSISSSTVHLLCFICSPLTHSLRSSQASPTLLSTSKEVTSFLQEVLHPKLAGFKPNRALGLFRTQTDSGIHCLTGFSWQVSLYSDVTVMCSVRQVYLSSLKQQSHWGERCWLVF